MTNCPGATFIWRGGGRLRLLGTLEYFIWFFWYICIINHISLKKDCHKNKNPWATVTSSPETLFLCSESIYRSSVKQNHILVAMPFQNGYKERNWIDPWNSLRILNLSLISKLSFLLHLINIKYDNSRRSYTYQCSFLVFHWFFRWSKYLSLLLNLQIPFSESGDAVATAKKTPRIKTGRYFIFVWMVTLRWFSINRNWNLALTFKSHLIFHHVYLCPAPISYKRLNMIYYMTYTDKDWIA